MITRSRIAAAFAAATLIALTGCGANAGAANTAADDFPKKGKSIDLVVAFSSGGAVDTAARLIQPILEKELGTNVEVINKPGAGGQIGYTQLTSAKPDGYTIGCDRFPLGGRLAPGSRPRRQIHPRQLPAPRPAGHRPRRHRSAAGQPLPDVEGTPRRRQGQPEVHDRQHHRSADR